MSREGETLKDRLFEAAGITESTLRSWLESQGIGKGTAPTILKGGVPSGDTLIAISKATGRSIDWLLGNDVRAVSEIAAIRESAPAEADEFVYIPRYDVQASAGNGSYVDNERPRFSMAFRRYWVTNYLKTSPKNLSVITVKGDSMEPVLRNGDSILVNHADNERADGIYVLRLEDRIVVKRTLWLGHDRVRIISENPVYTPFEYDGSDDNQFDFEIVGRVVWFGRQI